MLPVDKIDNKSGDNYGSNMIMFYTETSELRKRLRSVGVLAIMRNKQLMFERCKECHVFVEMKVYAKRLITAGN